MVPVFDSLDTGTSCKLEPKWFMYICHAMVKIFIRLSVYHRLDSQVVIKASVCSKLCIQ